MRYDYRVGGSLDHRARPQRGRARLRVVIRRQSVAAALALATLLSCGLTTAAARAHVPASAVGSVVYPGPSRGILGSQTPSGPDFTTHCNASINTTAGAVGGAPIPAGSAVEATTGCGAAVIPLSVPGAGHMHALFGIADSDTSGQVAETRVHVLNRDGVVIGGADVFAHKGKAVPIDVDLRGAVAVEFDFLKLPTTFLYDVRLSGTARALKPAPSPAAGLPAGATPLSLAGAALSCNMHAATATTPLTVTLVGIPTAGSATGTSCGTITLALPPGTRGTFVMRYGADDSSSGGLASVIVRVLDAGGRLYRKAVGLTAVGTGLQPIWADVTGARTVIVDFEGATVNINVDVTGFGLLPRTLPPYQTRNRVVVGGPPDAPTPVDPAAFVSTCNSIVGSGDTTVGGAAVLGGTYLATYSCGTASLFFCCTVASGTFHALFGVADTTTNGSQASVKINVNDKNNHLLRQRTFTASKGSTGVPINVDVGHASTISFAFGGSDGVLYDMRLTGSATISVLLYPSSAPLVMVPGGVPINPADFTRTCNASVADTDQRLVGATTLEKWALSGEACGEADLALGRLRYPHHDFYARIGILLGEPPNTVVTMIFNAVGPGGKILRSARVVCRYGYGTQPVHVSLVGASRLQIVWGTSALATTVVYAMTAH